MADPVIRLSDAHLTLQGNAGPVPILRGLSLRQRTIADNIANIETPRFLAGTVDFGTMNDLFPH